MFLTTKDEFEKDNIARNNAMALLTWSGEDIRIYLEQKKINLTEIQLQAVIAKVKRNLEHCEIGTYVELALEEVNIDEIKKELS